MSSSDPKKMCDPMLTDPLLWNPECPNFTIIDWEKFESTNPKPPSTYYPIQIDRFYGRSKFTAAWWTGRSPWGNLLPDPCNIVSCLHYFIGNHSKYGERKMGLASTDDMILDLLRPESISPATPHALRGVQWMRDNVAWENLMTFHNWAWKSCAKNAGNRNLLKNKNGDGVIGVGTGGYNWTNDATIGGFLLGREGGGAFGANIQMSPSGKWIAMALGPDFSAQGMVKWMFMYIVQPDDKFEVAEGDEDGPDQHKVDLKPGDLIRITWDVTDPYKNTNDAMTYLYLPRRIAEWDFKTQSMKKIQPDFDDYRRRATTSDVYKGPRPMCCGLFASNMQVYERAELSRKELPNRNFYTLARPPPKPEEVDRL